jgi:hypothetical protein
MIEDQIGFRQLKPFIVRLRREGITLAAQVLSVHFHFCQAHCRDCSKTFIVQIHVKTVWIVHDSKETWKRD